MLTVMEMKLDGKIRCFVEGCAACARTSTNLLLAALDGHGACECMRPHARCDGDGDGCNRQSQMLLLLLLLLLLMMVLLLLWTTEESVGRCVACDSVYTSHKMWPVTFCTMWCTPATRCGL